jgi:hypothetical protein
MNMIEYFNKPGKENTEKTLDLVYKRLMVGDTKKLILASNYGDTAILAATKLNDLPVKMIVISIDKNWDGKLRLSQESQNKIESFGHIVYKGSMPFEYHRFTREPGVKLIADTLRRFGEGMKVCVEIILMSVSGELVDDGEKVLAVAGTHNGADTAIVATAAPLYHFSSFEINEIICKPYHPNTEKGHEY